MLAGGSAWLHVCLKPAGTAAAVLARAREIEVDGLWVRDLCFVICGLVLFIAKATQT
jgi:hypothetical protein